jgi:transposase
MVLLSAQGMDSAAIAKIAFTSEDRVRDVILNFSADGFSSLYPKYSGGRAPKGLHTLLREESVSFERIKTWKASTDPHYAEKKARIEHRDRLHTEQLVLVNVSACSPGGRGPPGSGSGVVT